MCAQGCRSPCGTTVVYRQFSKSVHKSAPLIRGSQLQLDLGGHQGGLALRSGDVAGSATLPSVPSVRSNSSMYNSSASASHSRLLPQNTARLMTQRVGMLHPEQLLHANNKGSASCMG